MSKAWKKSATVSFELTNAVSHKSVTKDNGTITEWLYAGKKATQGDCVFYAVVETEDTHLTSDDSAKTTDSPIEVFCSRLRSGSIVEGGYANGKAAFFIKKKPLRLFGRL